MNKLLKYIVIVILVLIVIILVLIYIYVCEFYIKDNYN